MAAIGLLCGIIIMKIYLQAFVVILLISCGERTQTMELNDKVDSTTVPIQAESQSDVDPSEDYIFHDPRLKEYENFTYNLDISDADNIRVATEKFKSLFDRREKEVCDSALYLFEILYSRVHITLNNRHGEDTTNYDSLVIYDTAVFKLSKDLTNYSDKLSRNGFTIAMTEGGTFIEQDRDYVKEHFYPYLGTVMVAYLTQLNKENKEGFDVDGGLAIEPPTLVDRIVWWETFRKSNPKFIFKSNPQILQRIYTRSLITGEDNTPLYYGDGQPLSEFYKTAYDYLFKTYPETETARLLRPYYSALIKLDTAAIRKFQQEMIGSE
jgi:hypothetical protein